MFLKYILYLKFHFYTYCLLFNGFLILICKPFRSTGANMESSRSHQIMQLVVMEKPSAVVAPVIHLGRRKVQPPTLPKVCEQ